MAQASCATPSLAIRATPKEAEISLLTGRSLAAEPKVIGKGVANLKGDQAVNQLLVVKQPGFENVYVFIPKTQDSSVLDLNLAPVKGETQERLAKAESQLLAAQKALADEQVEKNRFMRQLHTVGRLLATAQRYVTLGSPIEANQSLVDLFKLSENLLPASAYTVRAKLRLLEGKRSEAVSDLKKAIALSADELEAKALLETVK